MKRESLRNGVSAPTIWMTGLSGAGKSTLARGLNVALEARGIASTVLDGDALRRGLTSDLGFSDADRDENVRRVAEVASLFNAAGIVAIVALISPRQAHRHLARKIVLAPFREIYVNSSLEVCRRRDVKGLYAKAAVGEISQFTGLSAPYEAPLQPDLELNTDRHDCQMCLTELIDLTLSAREQHSDCGS